MARQWFLLAVAVAIVAALAAVLWWVMSRAKAAPTTTVLTTVPTTVLTTVLDAIGVQRTEGFQQSQADGSLRISPPAGASEPWLTTIVAKIPLVLHFGTSADPMKAGENYGVSVNPAYAIRLRRDGADLYQTEEKVG